MSKALLQLTLLNRSLKNKKYRVVLRSSKILLTLLNALLDSNLLRFQAASGHDYPSPSLNKKVVVHITFTRRQPWFRGLQTVSRGGNPVYMSFKTLRNFAYHGEFFLISTSEGMYTSLSPQFASNAIGGICLFRILLAPRDKKK